VQLVQSLLTEEDNCHERDCINFAIIIIIIIIIFTTTTIFIIIIIIIIIFFFFFIIIIIIIIITATNKPAAPSACRPQCDAEHPPCSNRSCKNNDRRSETIPLEI
jgi:hypothetical protein